MNGNIMYHVSAADGGNELVIQFCSSVTYGISTGSSSIDQIQHIAYDNDKPVSEEKFCKHQLLVLLEQCRSTKIDCHQFNVQWTRPDVVQNQYQDLF